MTEDAIGIIASNLTVAYFSKYERVKPPERKITDTLGAIEARENNERFQFLEIYDYFLTQLKKNQSDSANEIET